MKAQNARRTERKIKGMRGTVLRDFPRGGTGRTRIPTAWWSPVDVPVLRPQSVRGVKHSEKKPEKSRDWHAGEASRSPVYLRMQLS